MPPRLAKRSHSYARTGELPCDILARCMAIVALVRGANVGGHRRFRPSLIAKQLDRFDVVNVGGTGVFVVQNAGSHPKFRTELLRKLPFDAYVAVCEGRDIIALERIAHFGDDVMAPGVVRFVSVHKALGVPVTTRSWTTIAAIAKILKSVEA